MSDNKRDQRFSWNPGDVSYTPPPDQKEKEDQQNNQDKKGNEKR